MLAVFQKFETFEKLLLKLKEGVSLFFVYIC